MGYLYANPDSKSSVQFPVNVPAKGRYEIRLAYQPHENRGTQVPVTVRNGEDSTSTTVNMQELQPLENGFIALGTFELGADAEVSVTVGTNDAGGIVHADAVQVVRVNESR